MSLTPEKRSIRVRREPEKLEIGEKKVVKKTEKVKDAYILIIHTTEDSYTKLMLVNKLTDQMREILDNKSAYLTSKEMDLLDDSSVVIKLTVSVPYRTPDSKQKYNITRYYYKKYEEE